MKRRGFVQSFSAVGAAAALGQYASAAWALELEEEFHPIVGSLDLASLKIIDTHVHPPVPMTLSQSYDKWNSSFVDAMLPSEEYDGKASLRSRLDESFKAHLYRMPRQIGYFNYVARTYGVTPDITGFDSVVTNGIAKGFPAYIKSILDRENVSSMVLESRSPDPVRPDTAVPTERFVWTIPIIELIQPEWAAANGLTSIKEVVREIRNIMQTAVENGCAGFKSSVAYYRPLTLEQIDENVADSSLRKLLANPATRFVPGRKIAMYEDSDLKIAFRSYQDFLLKQIFIKAGELGVPVLIHTAVGLHPALRFEFNTPEHLHEVFLDEDLKKVETRFVLLHTGYPYHDYVAAMLSQFPNLYVDLSFYSKFPGILEETLRAFIGLAPSEKIMHGSDSNNVPEEIGYCAWNTRSVLAKILTDYKENYGWTQSDCNLAASNILSESATRVFKISA